MNQKPNGWNGSLTRRRNTFPTIYASQHWILQMSRWPQKPKIHQSSRDTGFSLLFLLYVSACRRRLSVIAASPRQPILSTGSLQLYFRLCEYPCLPIKQVESAHVSVAHTVSKCIKMKPRMLGRPSSRPTISCPSIQVCDTASIHLFVSPNLQEQPFLE